jgi:hypothetical protein
MLKSGLLGSKVMQLSNCMVVEFVERNDDEKNKYVMLALLKV